MQLQLDANEINFILQVLGELPSKTGCFPLMVKIKEQVYSQAVPEETVQ